MNRPLQKFEEHIVWTGTDVVDQDNSGFEEFIDCFHVNNAIFR